MRTHDCLDWAVASVAVMVSAGFAAESHERPLVSVITFTRSATGAPVSSPAQSVSPPSGSFAFGGDGCNSLGNGSAFANSSGDQSVRNCHFASAVASADATLTADCTPGG